MFPTGHFIPIGAGDNPGSYVTRQAGDIVVTKSGAPLVPITVGRNIKSLADDAGLIKDPQDPDLYYLDQGQFNRLLDQWRDQEPPAAGSNARAAYDSQYDQLYGMARAFHNFKNSKESHLENTELPPEEDNNQEAGALNFYRVFPSNEAIQIADGDNPNLYVTKIVGDIIPQGPTGQPAIPIIIGRNSPSLPGEFEPFRDPSDPDIYYLDEGQFDRLLDRWREQDPPPESSAARTAYDAQYDRLYEMAQAIKTYKPEVSAARAEPASQPEIYSAPPLGNPGGP